MVSSESFIKTIAGENRFLYSIASPVKDKRGNVKQVTEVIVDITKEKKADESLVETKIFLDNIVQSAPEAIITTSLDDKITSFSPSAEEMFGYKAEDIIGKSVINLYPKELKDRRKEWKEKLLKEGRIERIRTKQIKVDGSIFNVSLSMALLKDAHENPVGIVGISHDITEHLKGEREREKAYKELKELNRLKEEILQNVSHELRTPITSMLTTITILKDNIKDNRLQEILEINERSTWRLNRLVGDLLEAGKIEQGSKELVLEAVDIGELIENVIVDIQGLADEKQLIVEFKKEEAVLPVLVDEESIYRVIMNLINNAIKFNKKGGRIEVKAKADNMFIEVSVEDTGIGISGEKLEKIFDRFYQVDGTTTRRYEGTGIGLALTKKLVEMHGGKIWAESDPGKWTRLTFTLQISSIN